MASEALRSLRRRELQLKLHGRCLGGHTSLLAWYCRKSWILRDAESYNPPSEMALIVAAKMVAPSAGPGGAAAI